MTGGSLLQRVSGLGSNVGEATQKNLEKLTILIFLLLMPSPFKNSGEVNAYPVTAPALSGVLEGGVIPDTIPPGMSPETWARIQALKAAHEKKMDLLKQKSAALDKESAALTEESAALTEKSAALTEKSAALDKEIASYNSQIDSLNLRIERLKKANKLFGDLAKQLSVLRQ